MKILKMFFGNNWKALKRFEELKLNEKRVVFYAEDQNSMVVYEPIIKELITSHNMEICYVTSSKDDPILQNKSKKIKTFCIGDGIARTQFFLNLKATLLITTMPDLETFHIKRSKVYNVHYVYIFHSIVSTHLIYRKDAFDNYDSIFCVGNHHISEIRNTEKKYGLKPKNLVHHGYGHLDTMLEKISKINNMYSNERKQTQILVAPSWGPNGLLETMGEEIVRILLNSAYKVIVRPHPMTQKKWNKVIKDLEKKFSSNPNFILEKDVRSFDSLISSDLMISDWSGIALEFAFVFEKPILYVDVPKKINNPNFKDIENIPLEVSIRDKIGDIISPSNLDLLPEKIELLFQKIPEIKDQIQNIRENCVFNIGNSGKVGAQKIIELLNII